MRKLVSLVILALLTATIAQANQQDFCAGFEQGYKAIKGNMVLVPLCPLAPLTPLGSTDFQEGIKAGMAAAN
jgi:hypothetical protein